MPYKDPEKYREYQRRYYEANRDELAAAHAALIEKRRRAAGIMPKPAGGKARNVKRPVALSLAEDDLIEQHRGETDRGEWLRAAALEKLAGRKRRARRAPASVIAAVRAGMDAGGGKRTAFFRQAVLSRDELERIDEARGEAPQGQWLRTAALEKLSRDTGIPLEALDGARRAAPRRRNYSERLDRVPIGNSDTGNKGYDLSRQREEGRE